MFSDGVNTDLSKLHTHNIELNAPDRFLQACPINYLCKKLFICLVELDYSQVKNQIEIILQHPNNEIFNDRKDDEFLKNIKKFAYPYKTLLDEPLKTQNSSQVQFYTFVFTNSERIRQYGFCRASQNGTRVLCIVSYLPWDSIFTSLLNKLANLINDKETSILNNFLEALYEYELPEPSEVVQIFSHDGLEQFQFVCPDRRVLPSMTENRNLMRFFAYFDLEKLINIFTALLLERHILIVSSDLEKMTSCALSLESLIYPLEWFHPFAPILPEHIDQHIFYQPFPYIYGVHTLIYQRLNASQLNEVVVLLVDKHDVVCNLNDKLPKSVISEIQSKLNFFRENNTKNLSSRNTGKSTMDNLLKTDPIKAFQDAVLTIIGNYRVYLYWNEEKQKYEVNNGLYYDLKKRKANSISHNDFYFQFKNTQSFQEFISDRADYLKNEDKMRIDVTQKDFIEHLFEKFAQESNNPFRRLLKESRKKLDLMVKRTTNVKDKIQVKANELFNQVNDTSLTIMNNNFNEKVDVLSTSSLGSIVDEMRQQNVIDGEIKPVLDQKSSLTASQSSYTSSFSSINDLKEQDQNLNKIKEFPLVDLNLTQDPDIKKFIPHENELKNFFLFDETSQSDQKILLNPDKSPIQNTNTTTTISNTNDKTSNISYQSIINEFDPIVNNSYNNNNNNVNQQSSLIQNINNNTKNNNLFLQNSSSNSFYSAYNTQPNTMASSTLTSASIPSVQVPTAMTTSTNVSSYSRTMTNFNPFVATPFYGQRHQFQYHSVAYPTGMSQQTQQQQHQNQMNK